MAATHLIAIAVLAILICWTVGAYNRLVRLKNTITNAFDQVDVQLKHRNGLILKLLEAAKKDLAHASNTLDAVITAHNHAKTASDLLRSRPANASAVTKLAVAEQALSSSLGQLSALTEATPELKADVTIRALSEELTGAENKVTFACHAFNHAVGDYNHAQGQFPAVLVAKLFSFTPSAMLPATTSAEARQAVLPVL
jgi:LemA protein